MMKIYKKVYWKIVYACLYRFLEFRNNDMHSKQEQCNLLKIGF